MGTAFATTQRLPPAGVIDKLRPEVVPLRRPASVHSSVPEGSKRCGTTRAQRARRRRRGSDIVHDRRPDNVERLLAALAELDAVYRDDPRRLRPQLRTERLDFDVLGSIDDGKSYDDILPDTDLIDVAGCVVRVLTLERLIEMKRKLTRPKDKFMLLHLEATLDERSRMRGVPMKKTTD